MSKRDLSCDNFVFLGEIVDVYNKMSPDNFVYIFVRIVANDNGLIKISSSFFIDKHDIPFMLMR